LRAVLISFEILTEVLLITVISMRFGRPAQIFTAVSGALFLIAVFTHLGTKGGIPGVNDFTTNISNSLVRGSIKSIMIKSESMWAKTVRQRHEIRTQFGDMGL
jgi:hypothetical protein